MILYFYHNFYRQSMSEVREFNDMLRKIKYDKDARQIFFSKYYNRLHEHMRLKYGSYPDWQDIVHDVVTKLIETDWTDYPYIERPISWLFTIADNHAKDLFKKSNRICEFKEYCYSDFSIEYIEMRNDVRNAMDKLDRDSQYIIYANHWLGKELYTIAEEMGKSYVSVRVQISRARKKLEKLL